MANREQEGQGRWARLPSTGVKTAKKTKRAKQDGQRGGARLPSTGLKSAKRAKRANAFVTVVTQLTIMTDTGLAKMKPVRVSGKPASCVVSP